MLGAGPLTFRAPGNREVAEWQQGEPGGEHGSVRPPGSCFPRTPVNPLLTLMTPDPPDPPGSEKLLPSWDAGQ